MRQQDHRRSQDAGTLGGVEVVGLVPERLGEAAAVLARAFHGSPNFVDLFPDVRVRARVLPRVFAAGCRDALRAGRVDAAVRDGAVVGVAVWLPPHGFPLTAGRQLRLLPDTLRVLALAPGAVGRLTRFDAALARHHPDQPYWYLEAVGVDPAAQGAGIGTALLRPGLERADRAGLRCYLETATEANVAWYRRLGFVVVEQRVTLVPGGPPNWTMLRRRECRTRASQPGEQVEPGDAADPSVPPSWGGFHSGI